MFLFLYQPLHFNSGIQSRYYQIFCDRHMSQNRGLYLIIVFEIVQELPQVENKLNKLVEKFEENHCKPFLYDGRPLMEIISLHWDERRNEKEKEKEFRVSVRFRRAIFE